MYEKDPKSPWTQPPSFLTQFCPFFFIKNNVLCPNITVCVAFWWSMLNFLRNCTIKPIIYFSAANYEW